MIPAVARRSQSRRAVRCEILRAQGEFARTRVPNQRFETWILSTGASDLNFQVRIRACILEPAFRAWHFDHRFEMYL